MKSRGVGISLGIVGLAVFGLGVGHTIADIIGSIQATGSANSASVFLGFSVLWPGVAGVGAVLCGWSYVLLRRKARS